MKLLSLSIVKLEFNLCNSALFSKRMITSIHGLKLDGTFKQFHQYTHSIAIIDSFCALAADQVDIWCE